MTLVLRSLDSGHLQSTIAQERWSFIYCKAGNVWKGEVDKRDVKSSAAELGQDVEEYTNIATSVFASSCQKEYGIELKPVNDGIELSWKRITSSDVKYSLGSALLEKCDPKEGDTVVKNAIESISNLKKDLYSINARSAEVEAHNERLTAHLEKFAKEKVELESELFAKFALILNEKKEKIRALKEKIHEFERIDAVKSVKGEEVSDSNQVQEHSKTEGGVQNSRKREVTKKPSQSALSMIGDDLDLDLSKIPRRQGHRKEPIESKVPPTGSELQVSIAECQDDDNDIGSGKTDFDDTVDAGDLLDHL